MSAFSTAFKNSHTSFSPKDHSYDSVGAILNQSDFMPHDQGQILGSELSLMTGKYSHLQHFFSNTHRCKPIHQCCYLPGVKDTTIMSPLSFTQAIDLSISSDGHDVILSEEKTPPSYGEVPGFVMARIRGKDSLAEPPANVSMSSQTRAPSTVRVCLEKKFNSTSGTPRQQDIQSSALSK